VLVLLIRFLIGGIVVSAFATLGDVFKPKSFAGLFGAAPSIALATLSLSIAEKGKGYVCLEARSMIVGAFGFVVYAFLVTRLLRYTKLPTLVVTELSLSALHFVLECFAMKITADLAAIRTVRWSELALRFLFGGLVTVLAGLIAKAFGPIANLRSCGLGVVASHTCLVDFTDCDCRLGYICISVLENLSELIDSRSQLEAYLHERYCKTILKSGCRPSTCTLTVSPDRSKNKSTVELFTVKFLIQT